MPLATNDVQATRLYSIPCDVLAAQSRRETPREWQSGGLSKNEKVSVSQHCPHRSGPRGLHVLSLDWSISRMDLPEPNGVPTMLLIQGPSFQVPTHASVVSAATIRPSRITVNSALTEFSRLSTAGQSGTQSRVVIGCSRRTIGAPVRLKSSEKGLHTRTSFSTFAPSHAIARPTAPLPTLPQTMRPILLTLLTCLSALMRTDTSRDHIESENKLSLHQLLLLQELLCL